MISIAIKVVGEVLTDTAATNVRAQVEQALSLAHTPQGAEVIVRRLRHPLRGTRYHVLIVARTSDGRYYALGIAPTVGAAVAQAAHELRSSFSRASLPETAGIEHLRRQAFERSYNRHFIAPAPEVPTRLAR